MSDTNVKQHACQSDKVFVRLGFTKTRCKNIIDIKEIVCADCHHCIENLPTGIKAKCAACKNHCITEFACKAHVCKQCSHIRTKDYMYPFLICMTKSNIKLQKGIKMMIFDRVLNHCVLTEFNIVHVSFQSNNELRQLLKIYATHMSCPTPFVPCLATTKVIDGFKVSEKCTKLKPVNIWRNIESVDSGQCCRNSEYIKDFCIECYEVNKCKNEGAKGCQLVQCTEGIYSGYGYCKPCGRVKNCRTENCENKIIIGKRQKNPALYCSSCKTDLKN